MTPKQRGARARARSVLVALAAGTCLSEAAACSEHEDIGAVRDAAAGHFAAFERFERWAERSVASDVRLQGEQALRETVFAPLRRDREVVWADVRVDARQLLTYRTPLLDEGRAELAVGDAGQARAGLRFTPIEAPTLGRVQVALCPACAGDKAERQCVVIARAVGRRHAQVRMAFCSSEPEAAKPQFTAPAKLKPIASSKARAADPRGVKRALVVSAQKMRNASTPTATTTAIQTAQ